MSHVFLKEVTKRYGTNTVIPGLNLEIKANEFISLLGPSGCGKTTLLRMIAGLDDPTDGMIQIGDEVVNQGRTSVPPEKRHLGMVFQSYAVWPHLTVFQNVEFPLRCQKVEKTERTERVRQALRAVRMETFEKRKPNQLSGGQQQRVALARALVARPKVLLLDEPLSNLDANLRDEMCAEIEKLKETHPMTMIYVTHDQSEAFRLSDRIALMCEGRIEQLGTPNELRTQPRTEFVRKFIRTTSTEK